MTTANKLTILRIALIPVFLVVLYLDFAGARWWALAIFAAACLTDFADGYIARHYNQITNFGKFMPRERRWEVSCPACLSRQACLRLSS